MELIISIALTISAAFGFVYGIIRFFGKESPMYARMIVFAIGCAMLWRLFDTLQMLTLGELQSRFSVGQLGVIGSALFFLGANFGQMDALADDGSKSLMKYRLIAYAASLTVVALFILYFVITGLSIRTIISGIQMFIIGFAAYFHLKHLIIPDVENGLIRSIRSYNLLALIYELLCVLEMILTARPFSNILLHIVYGSICVIMVALIPALEKGVKKWTT